MTAAFLGVIPCLPPCWAPFTLLPLEVIYSSSQQVFDSRSIRSLTKQGCVLPIVGGAFDCRDPEPERI